MWAYSRKSTKLKFYINPTWFPSQRCEPDMFLFFCRRKWVSCFQQKRFPLPAKSLYLSLSNKMCFPFLSFLWVEYFGIIFPPNRVTITVVRQDFSHTVKASNFVILFNKNIFFRRSFLRLPHNFFQYWNLYRKCLAIGSSYFSLRWCLGLENSFLCKVTKLEDRHFISSPYKGT